MCVCVCVQFWGKKITLTLCFSHPSLFCVYVSLSLSLCVPSPRPIFCFGFLLLLVARGPSLPAELVQLGLLRSLRNLPVRERVQLAHLGQLRLHHGRLGVHREGDRLGPRPLRQPPPPAHLPLAVTAGT